MWQNKFLLLISLIFLPGCVTLGSIFGNKDTVKPIETICKPIERTPLTLTDTAPLRLTVPKWLVITPANVDTVWKDLEAKKTDMALFALTDDGYEELSVDMAEIRNYINTQRIIIQKYKDYYEKPQPKPEADAK